MDNNNLPENQNNDQNGQEQTPQNYYPVDGQYNAMPQQPELNMELPPQMDANQYGNQAQNGGYQDFNQPAQPYTPPVEQGYNNYGQPPIDYNNQYQNQNSNQNYGQPVPPVYNNFQQKSKLAAGLFGIFLGGIGVHSFYLGHTGKGFAQIAVTLCTCGIGSIWGLIEGIMILSKDNNVDANGIPLKD